MKKILLIISVLLLTACTLKTYEEINYTQLNEMIEEKQDFILFIGSKECSACNAYRVTINKIVKKYNVDIKYIDISKLSSDEKSFLSANFAFSATPTTIFVTNGKEKSTHNRIVGNAKYSEIVKKLIKNGYIKEIKNE